jgi:ribosomal protein S18 acetylase RimI-like enzyme
MAVGVNDQTRPGAAEMTEARCHVRRISTEELDIFRRIRLEALQCEPDAFASTYEDWLKFSDAEWRAQMIDPIFVAFDDGQPVGLMGLKRLVPRKMSHRATLIMVYLRKEFRGRGLARELLETVVAHATSENIVQIELGVRADRARAIRFYNNVGFTMIGCIPRGYLDTLTGFDEILMIQELEPVHPN